MDIAKVWETFDKKPEDQVFPTDPEGLTASYIDNYNTAIQALHNMKQIVYHIVDKHNFNDNFQTRSLKLTQIPEEDYSMYYTGDYIIKSGNELYNIRHYMEKLAKIRQHFGSLDAFNSRPKQEQVAFLMTIDRF